MEALGLLAGGVAHDLNNILSGLVSYPELLLMDLPEESPLRGPIRTIENSGKRAAAIVQDLLTLARRGVAVSQVTDLNRIVRDYLQSPEHEKLKQYHPKVAIDLDLDDCLMDVKGSPVHLSKTVMNLVSNAAEAVDPANGSISLSTRNQYVDRPIRGYDEVKEGDYAVLTVTDNGSGIAPENLKRIFEPFYSKKVMGRSGTGLGMAVVWGTVKDHSGYIDVASTQGWGTTFTLYFPVTRETRHADIEDRSIQGLQGHGESILVVDDIPDQREIATRILTRLGYTVESVPSGEAAVEYMKTGQADLLILDMIMDPGMDGLDTYREILKSHPGQKTIIASGYSENDRVREAHRIGASQYVRKPYTLESIGLAVKTELNSG
jgi:CheY-like chemotaxis protein